jgi:hypothetical protein
VEQRKEKGFGEKGKRKGSNIEIRGKRAEGVVRLT